MVQSPGLKLATSECSLYCPLGVSIGSAHEVVCVRGGGGGVVRQSEGRGHDQQPPTLPQPGGL